MSFPRDVHYKFWQGEARPNPRVKPSPVHGFGLFAEKDYLEGEFVTMYGGLWIEDGFISKDSIIQASAYFLKDQHGDVWDAALNLNPLNEKGRWVNDILGTDKEYNTEFVSAYNRGVSPWLRTTRPVKEGEEFFVPYGEEYWKDRNKE